MTEQWQELKETIIELRDNDGTCTQQEVCKFLANYMDILEKQISNSENPNKCFDGMPKGKVMNLVLRKTFREQYLSVGLTSVTRQNQSSIRKNGRTNPTRQTER